VAAGDGAKEGDEVEPEESDGFEVDDVVVAVGVVEVLAGTRDGLLVLPSRRRPPLGSVSQYEADCAGSLLDGAAAAAVASELEDVDAVGVVESEELEALVIRRPALGSVSQYEAGFAESLLDGAAAVSEPDDVDDVEDDPNTAPPLEDELDDDEDAVAAGFAGST